MDIDARAFGQLEGEVKALAAALEAQNKMFEATSASQNQALAGLAQELAEVSKTLSEARGGWRTLIWIAGASASAAGAVTWVLQHITFRPGA